jgi:hypothetical protein
MTPTPNTDPATLKRDPVHCLWIETPDAAWQTFCGELFEFTTEGPKENNFTFCPYCGRYIEALRAEQEAAPSDEA